MNITFVTRFDPDDEAITRLHALAFGEPDAETTPWGARLLRHDVTWVGAFTADGSLVGFVHVVTDGGIHGFLLDTAVHPDHQRLGIGRTLVLQAVDDAIRRGCQWIHVDFTHDLEEFYLEACGFFRTAAGLRSSALQGLG